jgi:precorrin-6B methylase 2
LASRFVRRLDCLSPLPNGVWNLGAAGLSLACFACLVGNGQVTDFEESARGIREKTRNQRRLESV